MPYKYNAVEGIMCLVDAPETTFVLDASTAKSRRHQISITGGIGIRTSGNGDNITIIVTPDFVNQFFDNANQKASGSNYQLKLLGSGPLSSAATSGAITFSIADASTLNKGAAQFDGALFTVTNGLATIKDASTSAKGVSQYSSNFFSVAAGVVSILNATTSSKGVAQFDPASFTVTNGVVSLSQSQAGTSFDADSGSAITNASSHVTVHGANGITTSASGNQVTWTGVNATSTTPGVASFSGDFTVSSGAVTLNTVSPTKGGTGLVNPAVGSALFGNGSSAMTALTLQNGQVFIGSNGANPVAANISADSTISVTNSAGSIQLSANQPNTSWFNFGGANGTLTNGTGIVFKGSNFANVSLQYNGNFNIPESRFVGAGSALWQISLSSGQKVYFGNQIATTSIAAQDTRNCLHFYALDSNTWQVLSSVGNFTIT